MTSGVHHSRPVPVRERDLHDELADLLAQHISRITVMSIMGNTLANRTMVPSELRPENIVDFIEELMAGLRLFCAPPELPNLMLELAEFCDRVLYASMAPPSLRSLTLAKSKQHG